jgi:hypothetical protein
MPPAFDDDKPRFMVDVLFHVPGANGVVLDRPSAHERMKLALGSF